MNFKVSIQVESECEADAVGTIEGLGLKIVDIQKMESQRTMAQHRALHLFCNWLAIELQEKHIDKRTFFKDSFFTEWTTLSVKEDIWKPLQYALFKKKSTTQLNKLEEINKIWDHINKVMVDKFKGNVVVPPFPSEELCRLESLLTVDNSVALNLK